jgi:predicted TIM-barrel fold metal-dependent hydrolase
MPNRSMLRVSILALILVTACAGPTGPDLINCSADLSQRSEGGYTGVLFDAHRHLDVSGTGPLNRCRNTEQNIAEAVIFVQMNPSDAAASESSMREDLGGAPHFVPFFHVNPHSPSDMERHRLDSAFGNRGSLFAGIGEIALYRDPWRTTSLQSSPWPDIFAFARDNDLWVMFHVRPGQENEVRQVLEEWPDVRIVMHGSELLPQWPALLQEFPNLHITIDAIALIRPVGDPSAGGLMSNSGSAAQFNAAFDAQHESMLALALERWLPVIAAAPDKVMWGTDTYATWHLDPDAFRRIVDFSRRFITALPVDQQQPFAYGNARRLFGPPRSF